MSDQQQNQNRGKNPYNPNVIHQTMITFTDDKGVIQNRYPIDFNDRSQVIGFSIASREWLQRGPSFAVETKTIMLRNRR